MYRTNTRYLRPAAAALAVLLAVFCCACARIPAETPPAHADLPTDGFPAAFPSVPTASSVLAVFPQAGAPAVTTEPGADTTDVTTAPGIAPDEGVDSTGQPTPSPEGIHHVHAYVCTDYVAPSCVAEGSATYACDCGAAYTEVLPKTGHNFAPATCLAPRTCVNCGLTQGEPLSHNVVDGVCTRCGRRVYELGISAAALEAAFGVPTDRLSEATTAGLVTHWIYAADPTALKIFQLCDGVVCGAYITGGGGVFTCAGVSATPEVSYAEDGSLNRLQIISNDQIDIHTYTDNIGSGTVSASWAYLSSFSYGYHTVTRSTVFGDARIPDYSVQGRLCLYITNYYRAINGQPALAYSDAAEAACLVHSYDMAVNNYFDHADPAGVRAGARLTAAGVTDWAGCGENIQAGYLTLDGAATTNVFFITHSWYTSPDHRENVLEPSYRYMGMASAWGDGSDYRFYSTQLFYR